MQITPEDWATKNVKTVPDIPMPQGNRMPNDPTPPPQKWDDGIAIEAAAEIVERFKIGSDPNDIAEMAEIILKHVLPADPQAVREVRSRSVQRLEAATRGEPMPTFSKPGLEPDSPSPSPLPVDLDDLQKRCASLTDDSDIGSDSGFNFTIGELRQLLTEVRELREALQEAVKNSGMWLEQLAALLAEVRERRNASMARMRCEDCGGWFKVGSLNSASVDPQSAPICDRW